MNTSVRTDRLRDRGDLPHVAALRALPEVTVLLGDLVLFELLRGAADERHAVNLEQALRAFKLAPLVDGALATLAASHARVLRGRGVTLRKGMDLLIGAWRIANGVLLLHNHRDFDAMERHPGLRTVGG